ncbi:Sugar fermentation stimulation protein A [Zhongshania aliphaticivorans]|uniref:Sugar fermentation stimulation protein homolog n=1 Tax=Zhongshania aliphaticivorans TaxID=1470434 RepID=A0A5S9NL76_9GAMM|nr:DNA/RNA nuclease SfsA [Zhongshania aliphaticivorans]CAA0091495.1 Sugar fermentation stimulation protein A [Zhongshania aliphaticivorans]CAA0098863.1 Sugar fermentation stimulation protein A [Zhongshania aliphaticivorans]
MKWPEKLVQARLLKRYKRFLADVVLDDGSELTVHCPNTGAMTGCATPGGRVFLLHSQNPKRKYAYTWELIESRAGGMICIHSARANDLVADALASSGIASLAMYPNIKREKRLTSGSRIDFHLSSTDKTVPDCYVEVKSVTLDCGGGDGAFPDAVSARAVRHIQELLSLKQEGARVVLLFAVLHEDISSVRPAAEIDPRYANALKAAVEEGLEVIAYKASINEDEMVLSEPLPVSVA